MKTRLNYEMTQADLDKLLESMTPVPAIMLHLPPGSSQQARANAAWKVLGDRMGFEHMTVEPNGKGARFFTAIKV